MGNDHCCHNVVVEQFNVVPNHIVTIFRKSKNCLIELYSRTWNENLNVKRHEITPYHFILMSYSSTKIAEGDHHIPRDVY